MGIHGQNEVPKVAVAAGGGGPAAVAAAEEGREDHAIDPDRVLGPQGQVADLVHLTAVQVHLSFAACVNINTSVVCSMRRFICRVQHASVYLSCVVNVNKLVVCSMCDYISYAVCVTTYRVQHV